MASSWKLQKQLFLKNEHSKLPKGLEIKEKAGIFQPAVCIGDPNEIRTRVAALRGPRPRPLDDGTINLKHLIDKTKQFNMQDLNDNIILHQDLISSPNVIPF